MIKHTCDFCGAEEGKDYFLWRFTLPNIRLKRANSCCQSKPIFGDVIEYRISGVRTIEACGECVAKIGALLQPELTKWEAD